MSKKTALILLAAGNSSRMGTAKQLLAFQGQPLIRHAAQQGILAGCSPIIVVLGAREAEIRVALTELPVEVVVNDRWSEGMGTSIQTGLRALEGRELEGAILALADQPFVGPDYLQRLVAAHSETGSSIVASGYSGTVGVPVFFSTESFPWLMTLKPAEGCKGVIMAHLSEALLLDCPEAALDIDTPEDYAKLLAVHAPPTPA
jgi:molybdenum cofactor cytidylyltransferase